jgi:hypothetical protein
MARQPETSRVQPFPHELVEEYFLAYVLKRTGFSPYIEVQQNQVLKGTGFSPYIEVQQNQRALAPEGMHRCPEPPSISLFQRVLPPSERLR